jgi:phosphatidylserine/phosphatidylglycerophosphate/cardiolipin synthase-like enzyme
VHALIAFTNRGGEQSLRKLEMRLLASGISVARTAGDLVRYHGKMMIVDRKELYVLSFNFTRLDINRSRGFGLVTRNPKLVAEAIKLFEADTKRQMYSAGNAKFLVSPVNARKELSRFIKGAKKELLVYDPKVSDRAMLRLLDDRRKAGVEMRIIGYVSNKRFPVAELKRIRLHTRTIVRDRADAFIGSQSLRQLELDARREIGIIFRDHAVVKSLIRTFEDDWAASTPDGSADEETPRQVSTKKAVKKIAKLVTRNISLAPVSHKVTRAIARVTDVDVQDKKIQRTMEEAVKTAVEQTARDVVKEAVKAVADAG